MHHFFRRIPEARWRETVRARSEISTLAMIFSLAFALSRQRTSIRSHELERLTSCALLPAPYSPWQRSRFRGFGDADHHTRISVQRISMSVLAVWPMKPIGSAPAHFGMDLRDCSCHRSKCNAKESCKPPERRPSLLGSSRGYDATLPSVPGR